MSKFQVGDKVKVIANNNGSINEIGSIGIIKELDDNGARVDVNGELIGNWHTFKEIELIEPKKTKNQRITALEKEVAELKLIVEDLRERKAIKGANPSIIIFDELHEPPIENEIIEFEGAKYRKVDRKAREDDVVLLNDVGGSDYFETNKYYKVQRDNYINGVGKHSGFKAAHPVYKEVYNRTPETVEVYELIEQPKSANQQRAEIIEKAKKFVEKTLAHGRSNNRTARVGNSTYRSNFYDVDFFVKGNKVTAVVYWLAMNKIRVEKPSHVGRSQCNPSDVFNEHIGKVIALGRALGLDVSEFEQAVQPTEIVVGMVAKGKVTGRIYNIKIARNKDHIVAKEHDGTVGNDHVSASSVTIINDTNAIY